MDDAEIRSFLNEEASSSATWGLIATSDVDRDEAVTAETPAQPAASASSRGELKKMTTEKQKEKKAGPCGICGETPAQLEDTGISHMVASGRLVELVDW